MDTIYTLRVTLNPKNTLVSRLNAICLAKSFPTICQNSETRPLMVEYRPQSHSWISQENNPPLQFCSSLVRRWQTCRQLLHKYLREVKIVSRYKMKYRYLVWGGRRNDEPTSSRVHLLEVYNDQLNHEIQWMKFRSVKHMNISLFRAKVKDGLGQSYSLIYSQSLNQ
jgi:hypothetical protein